MEDPEQAAAYAAADFSEPHNRFIEKFREVFPTCEIKGNVLDLGCGPADISIRFARTFPDCKIEGLDGAASMLAEAKLAIENAGLSDRIHLTQSQIQDPHPKRSHYDAIISNSLLHHLHNPADFWSCLEQFSVNKTYIFVMDLMRPDTLEQVRNLVKTYAADEPAVLQRDFYNSLCAAFTPAEIQQQMKTSTFTDLRIEIISDRHWVVYGQC